VGLEENQNTIYKLLTQGMVLGRTAEDAATGHYLLPHEWALAPPETPSPAAPAAPAPGPPERVRAVRTDGSRARAARVGKR
jgi:hypothetical protein